MSNPDSRIYLASASPRRHDLLNQIGVRHDVLDVPSPPGEDEPRHADEDAASYVLRTACEKAHRAIVWITDQQLVAQPVLSADTTVVLDGEILGKPADAHDAARMLLKLSGRTHIVRTAVVLAQTKTVPGLATTTNASTPVLKAPAAPSVPTLPTAPTTPTTPVPIADTHHLVSETLVTFRLLSDADIARYVATGEPFGKAGAYGIQGMAGAFVQTIQGSYTGVMGLPIYETAALLSKLGIRIP